MTAFPSSPFDGQVYTLGSRSWTYSEAQDAWIFNRQGPTGPIGPTGSQGPAGVLLTSLTVDTFVGNGVDDTFTLSITPISVYNMIVNVDGLVQTAVSNYNVIGNEIIFSEPPIPNATIDIVHFLTGSAITGPPGTPGQIGPTGPRGTPGGPTGPTGSQGPTGPYISSIAYNSGVVSSDTDVVLGNIKARLSGTYPRSLKISTVSGTYQVFGSSMCSVNSVPTSAAITAETPLYVNSTPVYLSLTDLVSSGDHEVWYISEIATKKCWRITLLVGPSFNNNLITIENLA